MIYITLFHGSDKIIEKPKYGFGNPNNDYGLGFYFTKDIELAKEWANKVTEHGYVNEYKVDTNGLRILDLTNKNKYSVLNWLAILMHYRELGNRFRMVNKEALNFLEKYFIDPTLYDAVIGYRADDAYFSFPLAFLNNELTLDKLEEVYLAGDLGKQFVAISKKAINRFTFVNYYKVDVSYNQKYRQRKDDATNKFQTIISSNKYEKGDRIVDLMHKYD